MTETVDVAIIGGGIAGVSLAYFLSAHRSVTVLERETALGYIPAGDRPWVCLSFPFGDCRQAAAVSYPFLSIPLFGFTETEWSAPWIF